MPRPAASLSHSNATANECCHARIGLKMYNVLGAEDARDIQRDIFRPDYGATYNPIPRDFRSIFELLWGEK